MKISLLIQGLEGTPERTRSQKREETQIGGSPTKPRSSVYIVQKGDTLIGISKKTGVSVDRILELNNWSKGRVLKIGEPVKIK